MTPEDFARSFASAFAAQDAASLAVLIAPTGTALTLTGAWAEGRDAAQTIFQAEFEGIFAQARLVTGKGNLEPLGPTTALLRQRFVVTGALAAPDTELPRFGAMLIAVLQHGSPDCTALNLSFTALT
jgi:ketosteroid isomerase-like protein